jgi:Ser/Thr protein kinase RdoA (MazF antagonist)
MRTKNDDYYNNDLGIILEDLHDENVFMDENEHLLFIDPVIYLETVDMGLKGKSIFRFPFKTLI